MTNWQAKTLDIKDLLTEDEDWESVVKSMAAISEVLVEDGRFDLFPYLGRFTDIPEHPELLTPVEFVGYLLDKLYDYCDYKNIWVE